jgi:hypothetical protein
VRPHAYSDTPSTAKPSKLIITPTRKRLLGTNDVPNLAALGYATKPAGAGDIRATAIQYFNMRFRPPTVQIL